MTCFSSTETTKKELAALTETVLQVSARLDSLQVSEGVRIAAPAGNNKQVSDLARKVSELENILNTLQGTVDRLAKSSSSGSARATASADGSSQSGTATSASSGSTGRVSVSAKVKVENRYVQGTTYLPKVTTGPVGVVIINVTMDRVGIVNAVSINAGSTISDEEIVDQCKEAALRTLFSYNPDAPDKSKGTIAYSFATK